MVMVMVMIVVAQSTREIYFNGCLTIYETFNLNWDYIPQGSSNRNLCT